MWIGGGCRCSWYLLDKKACCMIIIFVVLAGFVYPSFPFPASRVRPTSGSSLPFSPSLCAPPLPGTGFSSQTRRGAFDKLASPLGTSHASLTSGPFLFIRQKAAYAVASLAFVFFALDYSPPSARLLLPPPYTTRPDPLLYSYSLSSLARYFFLLVSAASVE